MTNTSIDLAEAQRLATGHRQEEWLAALLDGESGFLPGNWTSGKWGSKTYQRIVGFLHDLSCAGYIIEQQPLGPRGGLRYVIVGYNSKYGLAYQLHDRLGQPPYQLAEAHSAAQLRLALELKQDGMSTTDALEVACRLVQP